MRVSGRNNHSLSINDSHALQILNHMIDGFKLDLHLLQKENYCGFPLLLPQSKLDTTLIVNDRGTNLCVPAGEPFLIAIYAQPNWITTFSVLHRHEPLN